MSVCGADSQAQAGAAAQPADAKASIRIDLLPFGYQLPNRMERLTDGESSVSLDFLDASHVLFTFDSKKLFQRLPSCPPEHADRIVHAVVLDVVTGKAVQETDWYLHDHRPYIWPFVAGKVLLRRLNGLYLVDANLHEQLLWSSPKDLLWVSVTPDSSQIIVETAVQASPTPAPRGKTSSSQRKFETQFLDATTLKPVRTVPLQQLVELKGTRWGYEDLVKSGDVWLVRFGPSPTQRGNLARVRSQTVPNVLYSSSNSLLVGRCPAVGCRYSVTSFSLSGRRLWQQHWPDYHWRPTIARSEDNARFAVSALRIVHATAPPRLDNSEENPFDSDDVDSIEQQVRVMDTTSGDNLLSVGVQPAMFGDENFAISPDGGAVAALEGTSLKLFKLPPPSKEQQDQFAELRSSVPSVYALSSAPDLEGTAPGGGSDAAADPYFASTSSAKSGSGHSALVGAGNSTTAASGAATGKSDNSGASLPTFTVTSKAVILDVVVTDNKGVPIHGLKQQDFQVTEDGNAQEIRYFAEVAGTPAPATVNASESKPSPAKPLPNVFSNDTSTAASVSKTLVLLDVLNTPSQDQEYAQQQLIKFLQSKPKDSQIALCTLSAGGSHLRLVQGFTPDETLLLAAAKGKKRTAIVAWQASAKGVTDAGATVTDLTKEGRTSGFQGLASALQEVATEQQGADTDKRVAITLQAMLSLARYLSGVPGRKNVVWLSGSFPIALPSSSSWDPSVENRNYSPLVKSVTNVLADAQIAVYPVDVRGLMGGGISAEMAGATGGAPTSDSGPQDLNAESVKAPTASTNSDQQALAVGAAERGSVMQVAAATGGKAFYNSNGISKAIETAVEQGSNYYTLSYNPSNKTFDGKFRRIKVALAGKRHTLQYRQGYFAESKEDINAGVARRAREEAMQFGSPASRELSFSVKVVPVGEKKKVDRELLGEVLLASSKTASLPGKIEAQHYSIDYSFTATDLTFQAGSNGGHRSTLILMIASFDAEGKTLSARSSAAISELAPSEYKQVIGDKVSLHQEVDIPAAAHALRLGIQDEMSGHIGSVEFRLPLPPGPRTDRTGLPEIEPD